MRSRYSQIINRINRHLRSSGLEKGTLCADEGRVWFDFDSEETGRSLQVAFNPELTDPTLYSPVIEVRGVVSPVFAFPDISEEKYNNLGLAVSLIYGENFGEILSFETDERKIIDYNPFGSICKKYTERLARIKNPRDAVDLVFEALTS